MELGDEAQVCLQDRLPLVRLCLPWFPQPSTLESLVSGKGIEIHEPTAHGDLTVYWRPFLVDAGT